MTKNVTVVLIILFLGCKLSIAQEKVVQLTNPYNLSEADVKWMREATL